MSSEAVFDPDGPTQQVAEVEPRQIPSVSIYPSSQDTVAGLANLPGLRAAYANQRLALFVGAGVSASAHFPDWKTMLERMATGFFEDTLESPLQAADRDPLYSYFTSELPTSPIIVARLLRDGLREKFLQRVRVALYNKTSPDATSPLIEELGALCERGLGGAGVGSIITYNFDDLIERELRRRGVAHHAVLAEEDEIPPGHLPIYHVHGFLPRTGRLTKKHARALVLSEEAYHYQFGEPYVWANMVPLNLLRNNVVLFVGLSMTDPNLRRLLEITCLKKPGVRHYAILRDHWGGQNTETLSAALAGLPNVFRRMEEQTFAKLGVSVIWVKDYDEIPELLRYIRTGAQPVDEAGSDHSATVA
jgi:hypothetical protein